MCFRCEKPLPPVFEGRDERQPLGGLTFSAGGNYGSRVWDPVTSAPRLVIWICDDCLIERHTLVEKLRSRHEVHEEWSFFGPQDWIGEE